ncbi:Mu transposase C-terminal domain-containing protein [uncultured Nostoc sp.]|uniref:Mu transposase C-terminal domain-containing protein n=1 Tax=uncultured Nostoc sp. TaxID=340711 RepID=UPI0035C96331
MGETLNSDDGNTSLAFDSSDELDEILEDEDAEPTNTIITQLSDEAKLRMEVLQNLIKPCDRKTYGIKLKQAAEKLGKTVRTVQRLVKKYQEQGLSAITEPERSDRGNYRIDEEWQEFIVKTHKEGNKNGRKMTPAQVAIRVEARAEQLGLEKYPSHMTVYRVLNPIIERKEQKQKVRNIGWRGSRVSHQTRDGQTLEPRYSNHTWQCDHTKLDAMLVDQYGKTLARPWLTKITDSYSRCIMGIHLGFDAEEEACITLRDLQLLIIRYVIDNYNQRLDARSGQTRFQRWEAGLPALPSLIDERQLDICLMKKTRRSIYKGGYVSFENITYKGEYLAGYAGEGVILRFDPRDISTVFVYRQDSGKEVLLSQAHAIDLETEQISLEEAKAASRKIRDTGKQISNKSILAEVRDRDTFIKQKKKSK